MPNIKNIINIYATMLTHNFNLHKKWNTKEMCLFSPYQSDLNED